MLLKFARLATDLLTRTELSDARTTRKRQTNTQLTGRVHGVNTCQTRSAERDGRSSSLISSADGQNILQVYLKTGRYAAQSLRQDASRLKVFLI